MKNAGATITKSLGISEHFFHSIEKELFTFWLNSIE